MKHTKMSGWKILAAALLLVACFVPSRSVAGTSSGEEIFKSSCASCHGVDGAGKTTMGKVFKIRDLRSEDVQKQSDADLNRIIAKGKDKMPAYSGKLKPEQIEQLVSYIRELATKH